MKRASYLPFITLVFAGTAIASNVNTFPNDPYNSKGQFENVRHLAVDPAAAAKALKPVTPGTGDPSANLVLMNATASFVNLYVNGMRIGDIEPLDTATLGGLQPGAYEVVMVLPNGFRNAWTWSTDPTVPPQPIVPAPAIAPAPFTPPAPK